MRGASMSSATEVNTRQQPPSEFEQPATTGVFRTPEASATAQLPLGQPAEIAISIELPYREARKQAVATFERLYILALLARCGGNVSLSARVAGLDRVYLHRLIRRYKSHGAASDSLPPDVEESGSAEDTTALAE